MKKDVFMQDKRARKRTPMVGTKKYPAIHLGKGEVVDGVLTIENNFPVIEISAEFWRFYCEGTYLDGVSSVKINSYELIYSPQDYRDAR